MPIFISLLLILEWIVCGGACHNYLSDQQSVLRPSGWTQMGLRLVNSPDWLE